jgi:hypothetical protein
MVSPAFSRPKSGIPSNVAAEPYPVWKIAGYPTFSAILALSASKTPGKVKNPLLLSNKVLRERLVFLFDINL